MVDAGYKIVKSKNLSIKICQKNEQLRLLHLNLHRHEQEKKEKSPSQKKRGEKRRKEWIKQEDDAKKPLTTDDSKASDNCESPPIVPGDIQMVDDIPSDSESTTTNDSQASNKCKSPLIVPGNNDTHMVDKTITETEHQKLHKKLEEFMEEIKCDRMRLKSRF